VWEKQSSNKGKAAAATGTKYEPVSLIQTRANCPRHAYKRDEGPDNSGILRRGAGRSWSSSARASRRFVALKVTFRPMRGTES